MNRIVLVVLCLSAVLTGCKSNLRPVTARVDSVRVDDQTEEGVRVLVTVQAENPNDVPLPVVWLWYQVKLDGGGEFTFTELPKVTLPAHGTQTITLPAAFALDGGDVLGRGYQVQGKATYEPPGEIRKLLTEYNVPLPSAPFKSEGSLP